jgi:hypothetical protein
MEDLKAVFSHSPSIVTRKTGSEYVLVPVTDNIADMDSVYTLNETGAFIWELIDGKRTLNEIIQVLISEYDIPEDTAIKDVFEFVQNLENYLIIE